MSSRQFTQNKTDLTENEIRSTFYTKSTSKDRVGTDYKSNIVYEIWTE